MRGSSGGRLFAQRRPPDHGERGNGGSADAGRRGAVIGEPHARVDGGLPHRPQRRPQGRRARHTRRPAGAAHLSGLSAGRCGGRLGPHRCPTASWPPCSAWRRFPRRGGKAARTRVLRAIEAQAAARGCRHLYLQAEAANVAAIALYEGFGFHVAGRYHLRTEALRPRERAMPTPANPNLLEVDWSKIPAPVDDGGARHLQGAKVPDVALDGDRRLAGVAGKARRPRRRVRLSAHRRARQALPRRRLGHDPRRQGLHAADLRLPRPAQGADRGRRRARVRPLDPGSRLPAGGGQAPAPAVPAAVGREAGADACACGCRPCRWRASPSSSAWRW